MKITWQIVAFQCAIHASNIILSSALPPAKGYKDDRRSHPDFDLESAELEQQGSRRISHNVDKTSSTCNRQYEGIIKKVEETEKVTGLGCTYSEGTPTCHYYGGDEFGLGSSLCKPGTMDLMSKEGQTPLPAVGEIGCTILFGAFDMLSRVRITAIPIHAASMAARPVREAEMGPAGRADTITRDTASLLQWLDNLCGHNKDVDIINPPTAANTKSCATVQETLTISNTDSSTTTWSKTTDTRRLEKTKRSQDLLTGGLGNFQMTRWKGATYTGFVAAQQSSMTPTDVEKYAERGWQQIKDGNDWHGIIMVLALFVPEVGVFIGSQPYGHGGTSIRDINEAMYKRLKKKSRSWAQLVAGVRNFTGANSEHLQSYHASDLVVMAAAATKYRSLGMFPRGTRIATWRYDTKDSSSSLHPPCSGGNLRLQGRSIAPGKPKALTLCTDALDMLGVQYPKSSPL